LSIHLVKWICILFNSLCLKMSPKHREVHLKRSTVKYRREWDASYPNSSISVDFFTSTKRVKLIFPLYFWIISMKKNWHRYYHSFHQNRSTGKGISWIMYYWRLCWYHCKQSYETWHTRKMSMKRTEYKSSNNYLCWYCEKSAGRLPMIGLERIIFVKVVIVTFKCSLA